MNNDITIVTGFGRCGTSLVMQVLYAAGTECTGNWPSFENEEVFPVHFNKNWLRDQKRKAVKIMEPDQSMHNLNGMTIRTIWVRRSYMQQARSMAKLASVAMQKPLPTEGEIAVVADGWKKRTFKAITHMATLGPLMVIDFEDLIYPMMETYIKLIQFMEYPWLDDEEQAEEAMKKMIMCVEPRTIDAQPDFEVEERLHKQSAPLTFQYKVKGE
jgi:hypothetical protein